MATILHDSDCAVHNEPATPNGPCDCGYVLLANARIMRETLESIVAAQPTEPESLFDDAFNCWADNDPADIDHAGFKRGLWSASQMAQRALSPST